MIRLDLGFNVLKYHAVEIDPDFSAAKHMVAALTGKATKIVSRKYVKDLFDKYSTRFDRHVVEGLEYRTPALLKERLLGLFEDDVRFRNVIDLGCGTGLSGMQFRSISDRLNGIDLSSKIVEVARDKGIYDALQVGDIIDIMDESDEKYNLFVAADVFVYIGDLKSVFASVQNCSSSGAYFVFSTENSDENSYILRKTGRFAHSRSYIHELAKEHIFAIEVCEAAEIRWERGQWVVGDLYVLKYGS